MKKHKVNLLIIPIIVLFLFINILLVFNLGITESAFGNDHKENFFISFGVVSPTPSLTPTMDCARPNTTMQIHQFRYRKENSRDADLTGEIFVNNLTNSPLSVSNIQLLLQDQNKNDILSLPINAPFEAIPPKNALSIPFNFLMQGIPAGQYYLYTKINFNSMCLWQEPNCDAHCCSIQAIQIEEMPPPIIPITGEALIISVNATQSDLKQSFEHKICLSNTSNSEVNIVMMQSKFTKDGKAWGAEHGIDYRLQDQFLIKPNQTVCKEKQFEIMVEYAAIIKNIITIDFIQTDKDAKNEEMPSISLEKEFYFELFPQSTATPTATVTTTITLTPLFTTTPTSTPCQMMSPAPESTPTMPPLPLPVLITSTSPIMPTSTIIMITPEATLGISETPTPSITSTTSITPSPAATILIDLSTTPTNPPPP